MASQSNITPTYFSVRFPLQVSALTMEAADPADAYLHCITPQNNTDM
jgi:hypothetical protein